MNQAKKQASKRPFSGKHQKKSPEKSTGQIRIIAGKHRGRKLPVLLANGLRPTTDRVKETVFNWLMPYINNANCLDCFAGSGGLGFEALSRGAKNVTLVELNKSAAKQLSSNKALLKADNMNIINDDALAYLSSNLTKNTEEKFDVVFIDPPFRKALVEQTVKLLNQNNLADQALIYVEMESEGKQAIPSNWQLLKEKVAGQVVFQLYQYQQS